MNCGNSIPYENFSVRPEKTGEKIISPTFVVGGKERSEWCLHIYPNGYSNYSKGKVLVYLVLLNPLRASVIYKFSILNDKGEEKGVVTDCKTFYGNSENFFSNYSAYKGVLLNKSNGLLINDKLTILCEAEIIYLKSKIHENSIPYDVFYSNQTDANNFKYKYTIQNFSVRPEKTGEKIVSPTFVVGSKEKSEWCLHIYPNGENKYLKEYVSVHLVLLKPYEANVIYKFSILNDKGEEKSVFTHCDTLHKNFNLNFPSYSVKKDLLLNKSNGLLVNDELKILCRVGVIDLEYGNHRNRKPYVRPEKTGEKIISPTFVIGGKERSEWCLHIYPNGEDKDSKEYVSVYLELLKPKKEKAKYRFSILNDKEEEKNVSYSTGTREFDRNNNKWGFLKFVKKDFLLNKSNGLLINDKFTIICEAEITDLKYENSIPYENFSLRSEKTGEKIISPTFVIGGKERSEWSLWIYPNGRYELSKEFVSVYLELLKPDKAKAKYRFSILNDKEEKKNVKFVTESEDFVKNIGLGFHKFVKKDFLLDRSNGLLINDKLTILCEAEIIELISENHENSIPYDVLYISQTDFNNFKYKYTIQNFSFRSEKTGESISSSTFVIAGKEKSEWCLNIYPNGEDEDSKEYVSVYLELLRPEKAKAKYRFSILNDKEEEKNVKFVTESKDFVKHKGSGFSHFVKRDFLLNESNGLLINDKLTILCEAELIYLKTENYDNLEIVDSKTENRDNPETSINFLTPQSKLSLDYGNLYDSPLFYDCVIKVEDTEIQVHKAILAVRSPAFYDIFNSTSGESQTNIIEIKDFNAEVVKKMLKYIYNDEVSDIKDMANEIFEIANKYKLDRLKVLSEQSMFSSLSIENVLERFALSDKYQIERLKECCEEIILKNIEYLKETEEWKKFIHGRPSLVESLLFKSINNSSKESNSEKKDKK
uniref:BTB domain-containing protein n=1 Tax=Strongyloides papillosus TaxID=174720 RepID=A0A0N5CHC3_STREA